jgi:hypothetical protein
MVEDKEWGEGEGLDGEMTAANLRYQVLTVMSDGAGTETLLDVLGLEER